MQRHFGYMEIKKPFRFEERAWKCDRDRIQTCNRLIRSQLLYSVELRGQSIMLIVRCDRDRIQTCNRLIRSQLLYSVELRDHVSLFNGCKGMSFDRNSQMFCGFFAVFYSMKRELNSCQPNVRPAFQFFVGEL